MYSLGLAGKPNAGKSTFFKAATLAEVDIGNYPFTTIDPNRGITYARTTCPCSERDRYCDSSHCHASKRYIPVELLDVAGLVPGAHEGRGLGNQFLDELMDVDTILNIIDASGATNAEGEPVEPSTYDPLKEIEFVETEIDQWLTGVIARNWESIERRSRSPDFDLEESLTAVLSGLGASESTITLCLRELEYPSDPLAWSDSDQATLAKKLRKRTKPILRIANKIDAASPQNIDRLRSHDPTIIPTTANGELALRKGDAAGVIDYYPGDPDFTIIGDISSTQRTGLEKIRDIMVEWGETGVQQAINTAIYELLDLITVFPVENETRWTDSDDNMLPDAILLPEGSTPRDLAYTVHSDIGEGYLHAIDARSGRRIGENKELAEGDVIKIVSTA